MKKKFNNVQTLKSSEDCKKFSKSVSDETLVGGTTTIGREYKQNQRLCECGAHKPLTAVGTLTSLLCNSAKVMEKWLQISPVLRLVKVLCLLVGLFVGMISETKADVENRCYTLFNETVPCIEKLTDENGNNSCGTNCTFRVIEENGKQVLHVYKEDISKPATIRTGAFSPKFYAGRQVLDANGNALPLNNIMLDNDFETLGSYVFSGSNAKISSASGKFVFNKASGYNAFYYSTVNADVIFNSINQVLERGTLNGDIVISDGIKSIENYTFTELTLNGNMIIPSSVKSVSKYGLLGNINGKIYCASGVEKCYNMLKSACGKDESCLNTIKKRYLKKLSAYPDGCEKLEANLKCTKCKNASFKLEDDGWCLRKIYTPAEAAEVLRNDNTNEIVITFKK